MRALFSWSALVLITTLVSRAAEPGPALDTGATVTGQISNAATRSFLEGAVVAIAGTSRTTITDREGRYQFTGVAPDLVTLEVSFTGLDAQRVVVPVAARQRVVRNVELTSDIYKLEKFTVAGMREGTAKAETLQRQAPNVKNVVSSDTFGNVADGNVGDLLQRIVGMSADYNGPEVRQVTVRGVTGMTSVTMDGQQVASAQSAGTGRAFEFEQASLGNIETIEVTKAATPDMDGASVGGSVNLVTKSAFDRAAARTFGYTLGFATTPGYYGYAEKWKQPIKGFGPSMNFSYSDVLGAKKNIGLTFNSTYHSQPQGGLRSVLGLERRDLPGDVYTWQVQRSSNPSATRSRIASGLKLDYRWSEQTTVSLSTSYNFFHENNDSRNNTLETTRTIAVVDAAGNRLSGGFINPNYANGVTRIYPGGASTFSNISAGTNDKSGRTILLQPMVRHRLDGLQIDYSATWSNSANYYDVSHRQEKYHSRPKGDVSVRLDNIGWTVDRSKDPIWPTITQTEGPNLYDLNNYRNLLLGQNDRRGYDRVIGAKFDVRKELPLTLPVYLKSGLTWQQQSRKLWAENRRYNYTGPDGILGTADDNRDLAQFLDTVLDHDDEKIFRARGGVPAWPSPYGVPQHQKANPGLWKEDIGFGVMQKLQSMREITERIAAAYVMGNVRFGKLSVLSGVRMEDTRGIGQGPLNYVSPAETARRAAWVGPVTDDEIRRRNEAQYGTRITNKGHYQLTLPGVHLKYEPFSGLVTRASWSTGVGRPGFGSIIPNETVNDVTERVTVSNPDLEPQYANNYDLSAEYYFKPQGMLSVGVFKKKITKYIFTDTSQVIAFGQDNGFDGQYGGYGLTTQANGGDATIEGFEFSYQQQLTFLPGPWRGLGIYTNFTKLSTFGNNSSFTTGPVSSAGGTLPGFLNKTGNIGLSYRGFGFDLRVQAIYRGEYLTSNSTTAALVQYQKAKTTWNWKSRYTLSRRTSLFLDLENIFSVPLDTIYSAYPDRVTTKRLFHTKIIGGITGRF